MANGEAIYGINHERKEIMAVGHTSWGDMDLKNMEHTLFICAPCVIKAIDQYNDHNNRFGIQELMGAAQAIALGYVKVRGFWE